MTLSIIELFAGVGGFRVGLEHSDVEFFKTVLANQWEPLTKTQHAFNCYQQHFPNSLNINQDIHTISDETFQNTNADLVVGGFPCFAKGTLITTSEGLKPIENIQSGDDVLTHTNTFKKVVTTMKQRKKGIYELKVQGSPITYITEEHPVYVRERTRKWNNKTRSYDISWSEPKWVEVKDLQKGVHFVAMSENRNEINPHEITKEEAWLLGRYMADGYIRDDLRKGRKNSYHTQVIFCVGKEKINEFKKHIDTYHVTYREEQTIYKCIITSKRLQSLCYGIGKGSNNKQVAGYILDLPRDLLKSFLEGYMSGDGCQQGHTYRASSVSKKLIYGLGQVVQKVYKTPYQIHFVKRPPTTIIKGRTVNQQDTWELKFYKKFPSKSSGYYIEGMLYMPIRSLIYQEDFDDYVYNFEVEDDNSYVANNLTVHNCQDYSVSRTLHNERGIQGEKGVLFWEIIRVLRVTNPSYILLENVDRLLKSPSKQRGRDFAIMLASLRDLGYTVEWRVINAADYGQAQRRRRVFIFGHKKELPYSEQDIVFKEGLFAKAFPVKQDEVVKNRETSFILPKDVVEISDTFSGNFYHAGFMKEGQVYTVQPVEITEPFIPLSKIIEQEVDEEFYLSEKEIERFTYLRGAKKFERISKDGHKYTYSEGGMSPTDELSKAGRTMLTSEGTVNRTTHIIEVNNRKRYLTPLECERLNGFPDNWTKMLPKRARYFCMGNALVVPLITRMGDYLKDFHNTYSDSESVDT